MKNRCPPTKAMVLVAKFESRISSVSDSLQLSLSQQTREGRGQSSLDRWVMGNSCSNSGSGGGVGVLGLLGVAFVVLKLTGYIDWSWWWVTAPFWGGVVLMIGVLFLIAVISSMKKAKKVNQ